MEILKNEFAEAIFIENLKLGKITWTEATPSKVYRQLFEKMAAFMDDHDIINFLSDTRNQGVVSPVDRKWFQKYMVPKVAAKGLKYGAVIIKKDPLKKYYVNMILKLINRKSPITMKIFYNNESAISWLKQQSGLKM